MEGDEGLTSQSYTDYFDRLCPYYMSIGMSYAEFWDDDVCKVKAYREAQILRDKRQNEMLWVHGIYMRDALMSTVGNMLAGKKGNKFEYPSEPYPVTQEQIREKQEHDAKIKEERFKAEFALFAEQMRKKMPIEAHPKIKGGENNVNND